MTGPDELTPERQALYTRVRDAANRAFGPMPQGPEGGGEDETATRGQMRRIAQADAVVFHVTGNAELRPRDLTDTQLEECAAVCDQVAAGRLEAHLRANGRYIIRTPPRTTKRKT